MPAPYSITFSRQLKVNIPDSRIEASFEYVERCLRLEDAEDIQVTGNRLTFIVRFLRIRMGSDPLKFIDHGIISINDNIISYQFFVKRFFLLFMLLMCFMPFVVKPYWSFYIMLFIGFMINWIIILVKQKILLNKLAKGIENIWYLGG